MHANESAELWPRAAEILGRALDLPASERDAYVAEACAGDPALRHEVEQLLHIDTSVADAYDRPAFEFHVAPAPPDPERIAGFELTAKVGEGGMSTVFRGVPVEGGDPRPVAIKVLRRGMESEEMIRRFRREGEILAGLRHPHIVAVRGGGVLLDGRPYLVMPFIEGQALDVFCRPLALGQRLRLFLKICDAVEHAHRNLVIHRDLKPSNILISADGEPHLLDFGISKLLDPVTAGPLTRTRPDLRMLTPAYAAPEQISGGPISTGCDIYALGTLLYQLVADCRPFDREPGEEMSEGALLAAKCERDPPPPSERTDTSSSAGRQRRRRLRGDLDAIVLQAMALRSEDRYASVARLADDLRRHLQHQPVQARPARWSYRVGKLLARHRLAVSITLGVFLLLAGGLYERERQRQRAEQAVTRSESVKGFLTSLLAEAEPLQGSGLNVPLGDVLASSSQRLEDLEAEPEVQTELMLLLGSIYLNLAEPELASPLLEDGWRIRSAAFGADDPAAAESLCALARRDLLRGELDSAEEQLEQAVAVLRRASLGEPTRLAYCLNELANVHERRPDLEAAETVYREAYEIALRHLGPGTKQTLTYGTNLAHLLMRRSRFEDSEALLETLVASFDDAAAGAGMRGLILSNLAVVRFEAGRTEGAEAAFRQALEVYRRAFGPAHPKTLVAHGNLGMMLRDLGQLEEARGLLEERVTLVESAADEASPALADALESLGAIEQRMGLLAAAGEHMSRSLELRRRLHGNDSAAAADVANSLGSLMLTAGRPARALELFEEALRLRRVHLGAEHTRSAISLANRGRARLALGRVAPALPDLEQAHGQLLANLGAEHWVSAAVGAWWANAVRLSGDLDAGRERLAPSLAWLRASTSGGSPVAEVIRVEAAVQSLERGAPDAAARDLETTLERLQRTYGATHPWPAHIRLLLVEARLADDPVAARRLLTEIRRDWPSTWGPDHWRQQQRDALDVLAGEDGASDLTLELERLAAGSDPVAASTARRLLQRWSKRFGR